MDGRRHIAFLIAPLFVGLILAIVIGWNEQLAQRAVMKPLVGGGMLLLVIGPVLIGNWLAGRKGKPPLS